ncbi:hypothetical protein [Laspinema palackyanum]
METLEKAIAILIILKKSPTVGAIRFLAPTVGENPPKNVAP